MYNFCNIAGQKATVRGSFIYGVKTNNFKIIKNTVQLDFAGGVGEAVNILLIF